MKHTGIAVIEGIWKRKSNVSIRGLFDVIANIQFENPNAYHYEMAGSKAAFKEVVTRISGMSECKFVYVATHGSDDGLSFHNGDVMKPAELKKLLVEIARTPRHKLRGIHLGACSALMEETAEELFSDDIGVKWVAGYSENIEWIDSSALDLLFYRRYLQSVETSSSKIVRDVTARLVEDVPGLIRTLGFHVFARRRGGGIVDLLAEAHGSAE
jgi:hypothetical protein